MQKKNLCTHNQPTLIIENKLYIKAKYIDKLVRWTAVEILAIQASSAPLYDLKHSGNKMFKIKTTDLSASWLQQEINNDVAQTTGPPE